MRGRKEERKRGRERDRGKVSKKKERVRKIRTNKVSKRGSDKRAIHAAR